MEESSPSFEQILNATVRMLRTTWKASLCLFLQTDDQGMLRVRAADGGGLDGFGAFAIRADEPPITRCIDKNEIVELASPDSLGALKPLLLPALSSRKSPNGGGVNQEKYVLVPVSGQARVLGILILGAFPKGHEILPREAELRSAGALCAVLSAHWRMYEWMSHFLPQVNHELRTPLTAVQGSLGMVLGGMFGQVGGEVREMLEMAHKGCERTVRAIEGYLNQQGPPKDSGG